MQDIDTKEPSSTQSVLEVTAPANLNEGYVLPVSANSQIIHVAVVGLMNSMEKIVY